MGGNFAPMQSDQKEELTVFPYMLAGIFNIMKSALCFWGCECLPIEKPSSNGGISNLRKASGRFSGKHFLPPPHPSPTRKRWMRVPGTDHMKLRASAPWYSRNCSLCGILREDFCLRSQQHPPNWISSPVFISPPSAWCSNSFLGKTPLKKCTFPRLLCN